MVRFLASSSLLSFGSEIKHIGSLTVLTIRCQLLETHWISETLMVTFSLGSVSVLYDSVLPKGGGFLPLFAAFRSY
jgi:hypothetical protein